MSAASEAMVRTLAAGLVASLQKDNLEHEATQAAIRDSESTARAVELLVNNGCKLQYEGDLELVMDLDAYPDLDEDWGVETNRKMGKVPFDASKFTLWLAEEQKTGYIVGDNLWPKVKHKLNLNAAGIDWLCQNQDRPEVAAFLTPLRGKALFGWGTILRDPDGDLCVRYLGWDGKRWYVDDYWLDDKWRDSDPALRLAS